jgi:hypothetical protein
VAVQQDAHQAVTVAGRVGMISYGVVHILVGWLAAQVALGESAKADQKGAVETIAAQPFGKVLLVLVAAGLVAFGAWQLYAAAQGYRWVGDNGKRWRKRAGAGARGVVALAVAVYAVTLLAGSGSSGGGQGGEPQKTFTARLLELPAGRVLVGAVALAVIAIGVHRIRKGFTKSFMDNLDTSKLPPETTRLTQRLGQVGYPAKGVAIGIIGILLGIAALHRDPDEAGGLDKALRTLAEQPFGTVALLLVAVGLAAYGVYCFAAARSQRS